MTPLEIKTLIDAMAASDLAEMEFSRDGVTLRLVRQGGASAAAPAAPAPSIAVATAVPATPASRPTATPSTPAASAKVQPLAAELTAPLYGVVHWRAGPDEPVFVTPGQAVAMGQVVCVIEAMKVFNEVRSERAGTVGALLAESGLEVEAGQPLLRWA